MSDAKNNHKSFFFKIDGRKLIKKAFFKFLNVLRIWTRIISKNLNWSNFFSSVVGRHCRHERRRRPHSKKLMFDDRLKEVLPIRQHRWCKEEIHCFVAKSDTFLHARQTTVASCYAVVGVVRVVSRWICRGRESRWKNKNSLSVSFHMWRKRGWGKSWCVHVYICLCKVASLSLKHPQLS